MITAEARTQGERSFSLCAKHPPPAMAGCCFPQGLCGALLLSRSRAQKQISNAACKSLPLGSTTTRWGWSIQHPPAPHPVRHKPSNWKSFQPHLLDLEGRSLSKQQVSRRWRPRYKLCPGQHQAKNQGWSRGYSGFCSGSTAGEPVGAGCTKPQLQNQGWFITGLC